MLVRPSVTPKDRDDYLAAYPKRQDNKTSISTEQPRSTVRFHPQVSHIADSSQIENPVDSVDDESDTNEEEDFPARKKPVKSRKQTGFHFSKPVISNEVAPSVSQAPKHMKARSSVESNTMSDEEADTHNYPTQAKGSKGLSMGMASKIAGAFRSKNKKLSVMHDKPLHPDDEDCITGYPVNALSEGPARNIDKDKMNVTCMADTFSPTPIFAEGISLFQPNAMYNANDNKEFQKTYKNPGGKYGFARIVEAAARHHHHKRGVSNNNNNNAASTTHQKEDPNISGIAPGTRAKLLELAKVARIKAQQKAADSDEGSPAYKRDDEAGWRCAGLDQAALLQDSICLSSLAMEQADNQFMTDFEQRKDSKKAYQLQIDPRGGHTIRRSASRHRLEKCDDAGTAKEVVWISRDDPQGLDVEGRQGRSQNCNRHHHRNQRSQSRHREYREAEESQGHSMEGARQRGQGEDRGKHVDVSNRDREHHRQQQQSHRSRQTEHQVHHTTSSHRLYSSPSSSAIKSVEQQPDKRKGKLLHSGAETQRLNLALSMARTRMEMEIADQQEVEANTKRNGNNGASTGHFLKDEEEKAWLNEAYEEAVKREVECQYLYDAHALGSTW